MNKKVTILSFFFVLFNCLNVLAEEKKEIINENKDIKKSNESFFFRESVGFFIPSSYSDIIFNLSKIPVGSLSISRQFNDYFELSTGADVFIKNSINEISLLLNLRYFPISMKTPFFIETDCMLSVFREYPDKNSNLYKDSFYLPFYIGLGYNFDILKYNKLGFSIGYRNTINLGNKINHFQENPFLIKFYIMREINEHFF